MSRTRRRRQTRRVRSPASYHELPARPWKRQRPWTNLDCQHEAFFIPKLPEDVLHVLAKLLIPEAHSLQHQDIHQEIGTCRPSKPPESWTRQRSGLVELYQSCKMMALFLEPYLFHSVCLINHRSLALFYLLLDDNPHLGIHIIELRCPWGFEDGNILASSPLSRPDFVLRVKERILRETSQYPHKSMRIATAELPFRVLNEIFGYAIPIHCFSYGTSVWNPPVWLPWQRTELFPILLSLIHI